MYLVTQHCVRALAKATIWREITFRPLGTHCLSLVAWFPHLAKPPHPLPATFPHLGTCPKASWEVFHEVATSRGTFGEPLQTFATHLKPTLRTLHKAGTSLRRLERALKNVAMRNLRWR